MADVYPAISGNTAAFTLSKPGMQLLPAPWNPSCLLYHDFAGDADGAVATSEALDGDGVSAPVRTWLGTTATVSSAKMIVTPSLGSELITVEDDRTFASDTGFWTKGTGWSIADGAASKTSGVADKIHCSVASANTFYKVSFEVTAYTAGTCYPYITGSAATISITSTGAYSATRVRYANSNCGVHASDSFVGSIDNISIKPITFASTLQLSNLGTSDVLADCYITALTAGTQAGLALCWDSDTNPQNGILVYYNGNGYIYIDKCVAGTWSNVASTAQAHSADARLRAIKDSTGVTVYHADTIIGSTNSVTDAGIISNTLHGVFSTYEGNTFSKVHVMKRGALNEFRELDNYIH